MTRMPLILTAVTLAAMLGGCLKHREIITIGRDGSIRVTVSAEGDAVDLGEGWPIILAAPWKAGGGDTAAWVHAVGPITGGPDAGVKAGQLGWTGDDGKPRRDIRLESSAAFSDVAAMPRYLAPESELYASATLERSASLAVESKGGRQIHRFRRVYHRRAGDVRAISTRMTKDLEDLGRKLERKEALTREERDTATGRIGRYLQDTAATFAREALGALYIEGDATLALAARDRILAGAAAAIEQLTSASRVAPLVAEGEQRAIQGPDGQGGGDLFEATEWQLRSALRASLATLLDREGMAAEMRNGVLAKLEWLFAREDHTDDLGDESFEVRVTLPGAVISGNFTGLEGPTAIWSFEGKDLLDRDIVLEAVSVRE